MKINKKTGMLLVLLAIPVFIWLFLKFFGRNQYEVPVYYQKGVNIEGCLQESQAHIIPAFSLEQINGNQKISESSLDNRISAVFFFSYPCDSACREVMEELARVQDVFEKQKMIQILAIDKTSSKTQELMELPQTFKSNPEQWKFLTGEKPTIETLAQCGFVLKEQKDMSHPIALVDRERRIRGYYSGTDSKEVDRLILEIRILLYMLNQNHA